MVNSVAKNWYVDYFYIPWINRYYPRYTTEFGPEIFFEFIDEICSTHKNNFLIELIEYDIKPQFNEEKGRWDTKKGR